MQEERPRRVKVADDPDASPILSLDRIKKEFNLDFDEIDYFCTATPMGITSEYWMQYGIDKEKISITNHHDAHCYGAYYTSGFNEKTLVVSYDAGGISRSRGYNSTFGRTFLAENNKMNIVNTWPMGTSASIPCMYAMITRWLGWRINKDEGKVTGLAGYGEYNKDVYESFEKMCWYDEEQKKFGPPHQVESATGTNIVLDYFGTTGILKDISTNKKSRADLAYNMQLFLENKIVEYFNHLHKLYPDYKKIVLSGGVFANVKLNQKLNELDWVDETYVYPAMSDSGLALGTTIKKAVELGEWETKRFDNLFYGTKYTQTHIDTLINGINTKTTTDIQRIEYDDKLISKHLNEGSIVGWFKGRFEFGPRALGARSILVRPTDAETHENLNKRLGRTEIMPFAPIVIGEKANDVFITNNKSHYTAEFMTMCYDTREEWIDKIPAVIHEVDKSARPQLVYENNPFYNVLVEYEKLSNIPVLLNTSFNVHGEPIIDGPDQAINHLMDGVVDYLVMEDFIYYVNR